MSEPLRTVNVGLIGLGTVGGGVARLIKSHHDEYLAAYGIDLKLTRACALAWEQAEAAGIEREAFTSDWHDVVTDPAVDIVVELIGGVGELIEVIERVGINRAEYAVCCDRYGVAHRERLGVCAYLNVIGNIYIVAVYLEII